MSSIDPSIPPPSGPTPPPSSTPAAPNTITGTFGDSLSPSLTTGAAYNFGVAVGPMTINQFVNITQSPSKELQNTLNQISRNEPIIFSKLNQALAKNVTNLNKLRQASVQAQASWSSAASTEQTDATNYNAKATTYNTQLAGYQTQDQTQVTAMNQAVSDYQNNVITASQFNTIAASYNSYIATRNAALAPALNALNASINTYNADVAANNVAIASANSTLGQLQAPPLAIQTPLVNVSGLPSVPAAPYVTPPATIVVPPPAVSVVPLASPPGVKAFLQQYYGPIAKQANAALSVLSTTIDNNERHVFEYLRYNKKGTQKNPVLPDQYKPALTPNTASSPGPGQQAGSGAGLTAFATGLNNIHLPGILSNALFASTMIGAQQPLPPDLAEQIDQLSQGITTHAGLFSTNLSLPLLADQHGGIESGTAPVQLASAAGFASQLINSVNADTLPTAIHEFLVNSGLDQSTVAQLEAPLTAAARLNLLQSGLLQISLAANLPGLPSQVLGNAVDLNGFPASASGPQIGDILANPQSIASLRGNLTEALALKLGVSQSTAQQLVDAGLQTALANTSYLTNAEFSAGYEAGFLQKANDLKLSANADAVKAAAIDSANNASAQIQSELSTANLDGAVSRQDLIDAQVQNSQIFSDAEDQAILNDALQKSINDNNYQTARQVSDQIAQNLISGGINYRDSVAAANTVASNSVKDRLNADSIDRATLHNSLVAGLAQQGISQDAANIAANAIGAALEAKLGSAEDVRFHIQKALRQADIGSNAAKKIAEGADITAQTPTALDQIGWNSILSPQVLAEQVKTRITDDLIGKVSAAKADAIAKTITGILFGNSVHNPNSPQNIAAESPDNPTSLQNLIKKQILALQELNNENAQAALTENFNTFMKPTYSLVAQTLEKLDPANSVIHSFSADPFNAIDSNALSNYGKKSTDIPV